jgi:cholesterol oxidase
MALANPDCELDNLDGDIDVIVVGSGYGAGVCAARLAEAGASVVVLERGREFADGEHKPFPETLEQLRANVQIDSKWFRREHRLGLYNFHLGRDLDVLVGCGLGGTSLINSGVAIKPDARVFQRAMWPHEIRNFPFDETLGRYYDRAHSVLQPAQYPETRSPPRKLAAMLQHGGERCFVNVHYGPEEYNSVGVRQVPCNDCGDCNTGCNFKAKKTLCFTYLPLAKSFGARFFVRCDVDHIELGPDGRWVVYFQRLQTGTEEVVADRRLTARAVVLGAGVLGTTGILLRSKQLGLPLSDWIGARFSGNGDAIAFAYNCEDRLDSVGYGDRVPYVPPYPPPDGVSAVGATILGIIDRRNTPKVDDGIIIEEATVPSGLARLLRVFAQLLVGVGAETRHGFAHWFHERLAEGRDLFGDDRNGALNRTLLFLLMSHDGADGVIELGDDGRPVVRWPQLHERPLFTAENAIAREITSQLGGMFVPDPLPRLMNNRITVHPLGGCPMGDPETTAVVDHAGRVFRDDGKPHDKLYVADASVIPTSLGINPLWTITALAERIAEHVARDLGRTAGTSTTLGPRSIGE